MFFIKKIKQFIGGSTTANANMLNKIFVKIIPSKRSQSLFFDNSIS